MAGWPRKILVQMTKAIDLNTILKDPQLGSMERQIAQKVQQGERISSEEGLYLFEHGDLGFVGALANTIRFAPIRA